MDIKLANSKPNIIIKLGKIKHSSTLYLVRFVEMGPFIISIVSIIVIIKDFDLFNIKSRTFIKIKIIIIPIFVMFKKPPDFEFPKLIRLVKVKRLKPVIILALIAKLFRLTRPTSFLQN